MQVFVVFRETNWEKGVYGVFSTEEALKDALLQVMTQAPSGSPEDYFVEVTLDRPEKTALELQQLARKNHVLQGGQI